jgi:CheY-like chemotaxis protein
MKKILIIDDDINIRVVLKILLTKHSVIKAENGKQGIEKIKNNPDLDLVITDYEMPKLNGLEVIKWVKANKPYLEVILMSGQEEMKEKALAAGASRFMLKPFGGLEV